MVRRWFLRGLLLVMVASALFIVFRQGVLPPKYTPIPALNIDRPLPLLTDWQLVKIQNDKALCRRVVRRSRALKARAVADKPIRNGCGWVNAVQPVTIAGVRFPAARMNCAVATGLALWVSKDVQPLAQRIFGQRVVSMRNMGVYNCRKMIGSRFWPDRMSEHATANAVDIGAFRLANGMTVSIKHHWRGAGKKSEFLRAVHYAACRYFRVALSPDFNKAHHDHFHFDRGSLYTCR